MSHQCICDKTTFTLYDQTVGTCHTCQELSTKMSNLDMYNTFLGEYKWFLVHLAVSAIIHVIFYKFQILLTFTKTPPLDGCCNFFDLTGQMLRLSK